MIKRIAGLAAFATLLAAGLFYKQRAGGPLKVSGFIEADEIRLGSRVGGRVAKVFIEEGSAVKPGDVLLELDPFDLDERRNEALAQIAARQAEYDKLAAGYRAEEIGQAKARRDQWAARLSLLQNGPRKQEIAAAEAQADLAAAQLDLARAEFKRAESLAASKVASRDELDKATSQMKVAEQTARTRREGLAILREGTRAEEIEQASAQLAEADQAWQLMTHGYRKEEIEQTRATLEAARAGLAAIDRQMGELKLRATVTGIVEAVELQPGDLIAPNAPVISVMDTSRLWIRAYLPENLMGFKIGSRIEASVDSFPGERFAARITFIARQAEFTPGNVQTVEERSKQVFRVKATLDEGLDRLRPGMSADLWLDSARP